MSTVEMGQNQAYFEESVIKSLEQRFVDRVVPPAPAKSRRRDIARWS